ncbi:MAG: UbiA family prenyltransferase [Phycisphaeraceae bacterium]
MIPLFVDLDGTLVATDCLVESLIGVVRRAPRRAPEVLLAWRSQGRPELKRLSAEIADIDPATLPYRKPTLDLIEQARVAGRPVILATASHIDMARKVADHLGVFDDVLASEGSINLKAHRKLEAMKAWCAQRGHDHFAYAGDANPDLAIWPECHEVIAVAPSRGLRKSMDQLGLKPRIIDEGGIQLSHIFKLIRPYQWTKNLLVFVPAILAHELSDPTILMMAIVAFVALSLIASAVYVVNDLLDIESDRHHRSKHKRPMASGSVPPTAGPAIAGVLGISGLILAVTLLPWIATGGLLLYLLLTNLYSFWLKRKAVVDVIILASLYTLRVLMGAWACGLDPSKWLLAFSMFFFLSLAFAKRYTEVSRIESERDADNTGRGYRLGDEAIIRAMGPSSGFVSILVLAMFIAEANRAWYARPELLYLLCPLLLYWVSRVWLMAHRGELHDDPVVFALRDGASRILAVVGLLIFVLASGT